MSGGGILAGRWNELLGAEFEKPYMGQLRGFLADEIKNGKKIFPPTKDVFAALNITDFNHVRVVIIGQDPYHGEGQAHGLCFSVRPGTKIPPSLQNIYKEMKGDLGIDQPSHGYLESWAKQGVLLLNAVLTVEKGKAGAHQNRGWESFTDRIIEILDAREDPLAFVLWGAYAQKKGAFVNTERHLVLKAAHPSPFSAHKGFFGCKHFSKINRFLAANGHQPIDWYLPAS